MSDYPTPPTWGPPGPSRRQRREAEQAELAWLEEQERREAAGDPTLPPPPPWTAPTAPGYGQPSTPPSYILPTSRLVRWVKADLRRSGLLGAGVAVAVVIIAATSAGGHQVGASSDYTAATPNQAYVAQLEVKDPGALSAAGDTTAIALGHDVCTDFDEGDDAQQVMNDAVNAINTEASYSFSIQDLGAIIASSVNNLCSEYRGQVIEWLQENGYNS